MYTLIGIIVVVLVVGYLYNKYFIKGKWQEVDMSRVTQFVSFINAEKIPDEKEDSIL